MHKSWMLPIVVAGIAAFAVAALGGTITDLGAWYQALEKPSWSPPDALFPIAWTVIFALIAISAVSAWKNTPGTRQGDIVIGLFAFNGFLNILWSLIFFRMQRPDWAFAELLLLWLSVGALMLYCGRFSSLSRWLLLPYLGWVTFAGWLNWKIIELNGPFG
ncbi:TspO/MBR family protein [Sphingomicrobium sediminis]|uniref:Tryptophan-rich sensory protein n=1 Tax=Sphingomicrobium sediminis TaxID=2950949 RepID=A0A9X2EEM0_9SPHN|nr:TspO/MBR family protein [Sphingomicrobium sediminis]MCM8556518.1 tryptophan-rich sensory protein [Sphingomicrobium sediminis]